MIAAASARRSWIVWAILVAATLASWEMPNAAPGAAFANAVILLVAMAKIAAIGLEYMELRAAHWGLRLAFLLWVALVSFALCLVFALPGEIIPGF